MNQPNKVSKVRRNNYQLVKNQKNFTYIKYMMPFNIRCLQCFNVINKGKKILAIKEHIPNGNYLGINFLRFYFKCVYCLKGISIKSNPKNFTYLLEINSK